MKLAGVLFLYCAVIAGSEALNPRIANNGETASEGEFPFLVSIQMGNQHFCGGSLVSKTHVLTAAHCVQPGVDQGYFPAPVTIEVGTTRLGFGKRYEVKRISYHRGFTKRYPDLRFLPNDIAVIHLTEPVVTSDKVAIINLPAAASSLPPGADVVTAGFGVADIRSQKVSTVLKKMDAKVVSLEECQENIIKRLHVGKMCAAKGAGYGTCKGDSGGPLVDKANRTLIGIVSGGDGKCRKGTPDVYTEVSRFFSYINEELNWHPGSNTQNPALNLDKQSGVEPPTGFPEQWPWPPQRFQTKPPQSPLQPNPPQCLQTVVMPVPCAQINVQQNDWENWEVGNPWPPGWRPLIPQPHFPWNSQQPQNPFQPLNPLDLSNTNLEDSISA